MDFSRRLMTTGLVATAFALVSPGSPAILSARAAAPTDTPSAANSTQDQLKGLPGALRQAGVPSSKVTDEGQHNRWSQQAAITLNDGSTTLGWSVSLDGNTALVGAPAVAYQARQSHKTDVARADPPTPDAAGDAAYVFVRSGSNWTEQAKLTPDNGGGLAAGYSVALRGNIALIGVLYGGDGRTTGAVYVYTRSGTTWSQQAKLSTSDGTYDGFGSSVALSGTTAIIGEPGYTRAYVYVQSGSTWSQQAMLVNPSGLGWPVALEGDTALVGDPLGSGDSGVVYVYVRNGTTWTQQAALAVSGTYQFGQSTALSANGNTALIGSPNDNHAYVFARTGTSWAQTAALSGADTGPYDNFGISVALSGNDALVGANQNGNDIGAAYVFHHKGSTWTQHSKLTPSGGTPADLFGWSVSLSGGNALVGAPHGNNQYGEAYVFVRTSGDDCAGATNWSPVPGFYGSEVSVQGKPKKITREDGGGTYIWHSGDDEGWSVSTADFDRGAHTYSGTISVTGAQLVGLTPQHPEKGDKVTMNPDGSISYVLHTWWTEDGSGADGFHYYVTGCANGFTGPQTLQFVTFKDGTANPLTVKFGATKGNPSSPDPVTWRTI